MQTDLRNEFFITIFQLLEIRDGCRFLTFSDFKISLTRKGFIHSFGFHITDPVHFSSSLNSNEFEANVIPSGLLLSLEMFEGTVKGGNYKILYHFPHSPKDITNLLEIFSLIDFHLSKKTSRKIFRNIRIICEKKESVTMMCYTIQLRPKKRRWRSWNACSLRIKSVWYCSLKSWLTSFQRLGGVGR